MSGSKANQDDIFGAIDIMCVFLTQYFLSISLKGLIPTSLLRQEGLI